MNVVLSEETQQQQESLHEFSPGGLEALIAEGERSVLEEGTLDRDEAFEERRRQRNAMCSNLT